MNKSTQEVKVLQQIEREVRMREGASKLLAACSKRDQALEASKSLLICNTRTLALLSQLQKIRRAQILERAGHRSPEDPIPCTGRISLSDLRIPLMWKDSEYFKNKGELHRCAVFCLLQCGTEIHDTDIVMVDRTLTDICFEEPVIFNTVSPEFQLRVELYSSCAVDDVSPAVLTLKRGSFLTSSLGHSSGKKLRAAFESAAGCGSAGGDVRRLSFDQSSMGSKFNLLAHTTLNIDHVVDGFKTHDLTILAAEESPFWLPLYGSMCCRLVAQPLCMVQTVLCGQLRVKLKGDPDDWEDVHAVIRERSLLFYHTREDLESERNPVFVIPIRKDTYIHVSEANPADEHHIYITAKLQGKDVTYVMTARSDEDTQRCNEALQQHVYNLTRWKQSCDRLMKIEVPKPKRASTLKRGSLFHEIVTPSSPSKGPVDSDLSNEIRTLLSSYYKERFPEEWTPEEDEEMEGPDRWRP